MIIAGLIFLAGCQVQTETKYQCANGEVVDSIDLCSSQTCPELDCSECPKQIETETKEVIKYQCYDGTVKDDLEDCDVLEVNQQEETTINQENADCPNEVDYLFTEYNYYQSLASKKLEEIFNIEEFDDGIYYSDRNNYFGAYGGNEGIENKKECGKIYFILYKSGEWDSINYWAIEMDAETGELIKYEEVTKGTNEIDYEKLWW